MKTFLVIALTMVISTAAGAQFLRCPVCTGPNAALQTDGRRCFCATIAVTPGPPGPPGPPGVAATLPAPTCTPEQTPRWNGNAWDCLDTKYLVAE